MNLTTRVNDAIVQIEYTPDREDGSVNINDMKITYHGLDVLELISDDDAQGLTMECEAHYREHLAAEANETALDMGEYKAMERASLGEVAA